ncbi:MAG: hypothetical protein AAFQ17_08050 [Pseudomonadota bacterium]
MFLAMNDEGLIFLVVLAGVGGFIAVTAIVFTSVRRVFESRHRERSLGDRRLHRRGVDDRRGR